MRVSETEWKGSDEALYGEADISVTARDSERGVTITMAHDEYQSISGKLMLELAAFLLEKYCKDRGVEISGRVLISVLPPPK